MSTTDLYRAILSQKYQTAKNLFNAVMHQKLHTAMSAQYRETAKTFVTPQKPPQS